MTDTLVLWALCYAVLALALHTYRFSSTPVVVWSGEWL